MRPDEFLELVRPENRQVVFRLGTIPAGYAGGRPQVQFDGESAASSRTYTYLASYTPAAGDRVLVAIVGHGAVVLGKVV